ncbi:MFS transporter permease [Micromonospora carbonacea]|uniref:MFS transporter permease n=1 Tax=Micromonospora carbonacea TaxID=47853 RepID=UPI003D74BA77
MTRWLTEAVPRGRVAAFRTLVYLFVAADLVFFTPWVRARASVPDDLYQPLLVGRVLPLPTPTPALVGAIFWTLLALALLAATGRAHRLLGWSVFALYLEWMIIAMSYGKVDHDRFGLLVALAALPTAGRARHGDPTRTEAGGWALRVTQIAVICTYFLAAFAKFRFGGLDWATGSVLAKAIIRRGTDLADLIAGVPHLLLVAQFGILAFELLSPVVFVLPPRWRLATVGFFYSFHLVTMATITISFAPHLVAMASFLPLERVRPVVWLRGLGRGGPRGRPRRDGPAGRPGQLDDQPRAATGDGRRPAPLHQP